VCTHTRKRLRQEQWEDMVNGQGDTVVACLQQLYGGCDYNDLNSWFFKAEAITLCTKSVPLCRVEVAGASAHGNKPFSFWDAVG
jgi:hypothetical protein